MDFLSFPRDPIDHGELSILPVLSEHGYDNGPFLEYLDRHPRSLFQESGGKRLIREDEVERHYQDWLFLGLLHELLDDLFNERDYIYYDETLGYSCITTSGLRSTLQKWTRSRLSGVLARDAKLLHFKACLEEVYKMLELTERTFVGHGPRLGLQVDLIAAVAELFTNVIKKEQPKFDLMDDTMQSCAWRAVSYQARHSVLDECIARMINLGGWCNADAQMCLNHLDTFEAWQYLRHLKLRDDCSLHARCNMLDCEVATARHSSILPKHVTPGCGCESFDAGQAGLAKAYERDYLPCLQIQPGDVHDAGPTESANATKVKIVPVSFKMKREARYVAMSHVWSDGTGNGLANSLPLCQLHALYNRVVSYHQTRDDRFEGKPVLLWIDTVCCPYQQGTGKKLAFARMKEIYQNATAVHVWDQSLLSWNSGNDYREWTIRILLSMWMYRLWTGQEAIFATQDQENTIIMHCKNRAEPLTWLYRQGGQRDQFGSTLGRDVAFQAMRVEKIFWPGVGGSSPQQLLMAASILQYRNTSVAADESLVLANILGLDGAEFIGLTQEEGMCKFWLQVSATLGPQELHSCIPFVPTPKLNTKGLRWAPRSLLDRNEYGPLAFFASSSNPRYHAEIVAAGLVVNLCGISIKPCRGPKAVCLLGNDVNDCTKNLVQASFPMSDGSWLRMGSSTLYGQDLFDVQTRLYDRLHRGTLAFVFQHPGVKEEPVLTHGLALEYAGERDGLQYAIIDCHVGVDMHRHYPARLHAAAREVALQLLSALENMDSQQPLGTDNTTRLFDEHVRDFLTDHEDLCDTLRKNSREDLRAKKDWSFEEVVEEFKTRVHHHVHIGPVEIVEYDEWTKWYLAVCSEATSNLLNETQVP